VHRLLVIIPALDEEETVATVVQEVLLKLGADALVVDDGSSDATVERSVAAGADVLRHPFNLGVGAAVRTGLRYGHENGYDVVVQIDADGQHEVGDAAGLARMVVEAGADLVVGSRFSAGYSVSPLRRSTMRLLARLVTRYLGTEITDSTSGYRAFGPDAMRRFSSGYPTAYLSDTVGALLLAADWGMVVAEVPVRMHPRKGGRPSSGPLVSAYYLLRLSLVIALHRVRRPLYRQWRSP
jgi:glycosyltransferase involved in cell wall biosynthesis